MNVNKRFRSSESGQTSTEYAIVLGAITSGIVLAMTQLSSVTQAAIERVVGFLP